MPYKRPDSTLWQVRRRNLPGFGDTGVLASGVKNKRLAERMERTLEELAERALMEPSYRAIVEAVIEKRIDLATLQRFHSEGDMAGLRALLTDPSLADAVAAHLAVRPMGGQMEMASEHLVVLCPPRARLSHLRSARVIEDLCRRAERGEPLGYGRSKDELVPRKRNSVRRRLLRYISLLLGYHLGAAERASIFADVHFAAEDDTREVLLETFEITALLQACATMHAQLPGSMYDELAAGIRLALVTSADRGVIFAGSMGETLAQGLRVRQVRVFVETGPDGGDVYSGEVYLKDTKNANRKRTVPVPDVVARELLEYCSGKGPDETVFQLSYQQLDVRWKRVCKMAGIEGTRFKDLRAQTAIYAERADVPLTTISSTMGHGDRASTRRYQRHKSTMSNAQSEAIGREMGLGSEDDAGGSTPGGSAPGDSGGAARRAV